MSEKEFHCGTCPFWHEIPGFKFQPPPGTPKELIDEMKDRRPGHCSGNPPQVHLVPRVVGGAVLRGDGQQQLGFEPTSFKPPLLDNEPGCHLHPDAPINKLQAEGLRRSLEFRKEASARAKALDEAIWAITKQISGA